MMRTGGIDLYRCGSGWELRRDRRAAILAVSDGAYTVAAVRRCPFHQISRNGIFNRPFCDLGR
jgi:hypothetical protein